MLATAAAIAVGACMPCATRTDAATISAPRAQEPDEGAVIRFDDMAFDLGAVPLHGEPRKCVFTFTNTGTAPLVVIRTAVSCNCLETEFSRRPVMTGEQGSITVTYTPKNKGDFSDNIKIFTNSSRENPAVLFLRGTVVAD